MWLSDMLTKGKHIELREIEGEELMQAERHLKKKLAAAGIMAPDCLGDHEQGSQSSSETLPREVQLNVTSPKSCAKHDHEETMQVETPESRQSLQHENQESIGQDAAPNSQTPETQRKRMSDASLPAEAVLVRTSKKARTEYIASRVEEVNGKSVAEACDGSVTYTTKAGKQCSYRRTDAKYDIASGLLQLRCEPAQSEL